MKTLLCAIAAWLGCAGAASATISVAPPPPAGASAVQDALRKHAGSAMAALMAELNRYTRPQEELGAELVAVLGEILEGADNAQKLHQKGVARLEARAWSGPWAARQTERLSGLRAKAAALPVFERTRLTALAGQDPDARRLADMLGRLPGAAAAMTAEADQRGREVVRAAALAAEGDSAAAQRLGPLVIRLTVATLAAENRGMELALSGLPAEHPQAHLTQAALATNQAVGELLEAQAAYLLEGDTDLASRADAIGRRLDAAEAAADRMAPAGERMAAVMMGPEMTAVLPQAPAIAAALRTYGESAEVERSIAAALRGAVGALRAREVDWDVVAGRLKAIESLVERRAALQTARMAQLTR